MFSRGFAKAINKVGDWLPGDYQPPASSPSDDLSLVPIEKESVSNNEVKVTSVHDLKPRAYVGQQSQGNWQQTVFDGEKFPSGYGPTLIEFVDYWTLRQRSSELFNNNLYAKGLIRRHITNEIHTGLTPEVIPENEILNLDEDVLAEWSDKIEAKFRLWGKNPQSCDWKRQDTFGGLQRTARREALIDGDVLVLQRTSQRTNTLTIQLIRGNRVRSPVLGDRRIPKNHLVKHGVEFDVNDRIVAYWVVQQDRSNKRLPAFGEKSGRKLAWLVFGTEKRLDDVRGQPLLASILQSLKEIDRYRDSVQRSAVVNSFIALFIKKTEDKIGSLPIQGGAFKNDVVTGTNDDGEPIKRNITGLIPGMVLEDLQEGEEPVGFNADGVDLNFPEFEKAILAAISWSSELPPEILWLAFTNNYSASQAALNEYKIYLAKFWVEFGEDFCAPIYNAWLINEALKAKIQATSLLQSWRDPLEQEIFSAWTNVDWFGSVKISTDVLKQAKGSELLIGMALSTHDREARLTNGSKWRRNAKKVERENKLLAEAMRPILEMKKEFGDQATDEAINAVKDAAFELRAVKEEMMDG